MSEMHCRSQYMRVHTVFPRNLAMARFNFKVLYHVATIRGRLDFEGSVYRNRHARAYTASAISLFVCTHNARSHTYIVVDPVPCSEISRAAFIGMSWLKYAATFWGNTVYAHVQCTSAPYFSHVHTYHVHVHVVDYGYICYGHSMLARSSINSHSTAVYKCYCLSREYTFALVELSLSFQQQAVRPIVVHLNTVWIMRIECRLHKSVPHKFLSRHTCTLQCMKHWNE